MGNRHDTLKIRIATIRRGDRGHSENKKVSWASLCERLGDPVVDEKHTLPQYLDLPIDRQNKLKDVGSFVGGPFRDGIRKGTNLIHRSIVTLDVDSATDSQIESLRLGLSDLCKYEFFASTTRKHSKKKPRWRLVFPMTRPVEVEEYGPLARILASMLFDTVAESMDATDDVSYRPAQVMYWPSVCKDALFETIHNKGKLLDPDFVLDNFGDWRDWTRLPFSEQRGQKRPAGGKKAEDPREKKGLIGAFCRVYDVPAAIEAFLADQYEPGDPNSQKPRYTYIHGSSSNGAVVEDDGLFLYSHHGTDPCAERLVNAFDLVRIHLFGEYDANEPEDARQTDLPSFKGMWKLVRDDEEVRGELDGYEPYEGPKFDDLGDDEETSPPKKPKKQREKDDSDEFEEKPEKKAADGPDMSILKASRFPAPPFPVDLLGPFWADRVKKWANDKSAPVDYTATALLIGAASLIGNARRVSPRVGWVEPCILWGAVVGSPSSKKSPALDPVGDALTAIESEWIGPHKDALREWETEKRLAEQKRKIWEARVDDAVQDKDADEENDIETMPQDCVVPRKPVCRRAKITDSTLEALVYNLEGNPRGLLCLHDELSAWYSSFTRYSGGSSSDRSVWLQAYGGREYKVDRVKHLDAPVVIPSFAVSILGGLQPDKLRDFLKLSDDGLQARFLYAWPEPVFVRSSVSEEEDNGAAVALRRLADLEMEIQSNGRPDPEILPMSGKAWKKFDQWCYDRLVDERHTTGALQGAYGKADGMVARLALVLEYLWWAADIFGDYEAPQRVSLKAVSAAIRLRDEYFKPMQVRVFNHGESGAGSDKALRLAAWVLKEKPKSVTTHALTHKTYGCGFSPGDAKQAAEAIDFLVKAGWLAPAEARTGKRGRPMREFTVDPRVYRLADALEP